MGLTDKQTALVHASMAAEKLAAAAHVAYWMDRDSSANAGYQIRKMREEFRKLELAFADLDATPVEAAQVEVAA